MMRNAPGQQGYTLIEVLIAASILAGLAAVLGPAIHASIKVSARIAAYGVSAENARIADDALAELFAAAVTPNSPDDQPAFSGGPDSLTFTVLFDMEAGPELVSLKISDGRLLYRPPASADGRPSGDAIVLIEDAGEFRYFGRANERASAEWRRDWTPAAPPTLVEVSRANENGALTSLTFLLASTAPIHCLFDQVSRKCRD